MQFLPLYSKNMSWKRHKQNYICMGQTYDSVLMILDGSMNKGKYLWWHSAAYKELLRIPLQIKKFGITLLRKERT